MQICHLEDLLFEIFIASEQGYNPNYTMDVHLYPNIQLQWVMIRVWSRKQYRIAA